MTEKLKPFKKGQTCFYMLGNRIHKGEVRATFEMDSINVKYLVECGGSRIWMFDHHLYHTINELIDDLKSVIVS